MRARLIKPGFFRDVKLLALPVLTRHLFAGLWCLADRDGRLVDEPMQIKIDVLPLDEGDVDAMLDALSGAGLITRYTANGKRYMEVVNFLKHQTPNVREPASTIPAPRQHSTDTVPVLRTRTVPVPEAVAVAVAEAEQDSPAGAHTHEEPAKDPRYSADFLKLWTRYPQKGRTDKPGAFAEFKVQRPDIDTLDSGLTRWEHSQRWADGIIPALKKWLKERRFDDEPEPAGSARASPNGHASKRDIIMAGLDMTGAKHDTNGTGAGDEYLDAYVVPSGDRRGDRPRPHQLVRGDPI